MMAYEAKRLGNEAATLEMSSPALPRRGAFARVAGCSTSLSLAHGAENPAACTVAIAVWEAAE